MAAGLPYDAEVEYLEGTGTQWIETGVTLDSNSFVRVSCMRTDSSGYATPTSFLEYVYDQDGVRFLANFLVTFNGVNYTVFRVADSFTQTYTPGYPLAMHTYGFGLSGANSTMTVDGQVVYTSTTTHKEWVTTDTAILFGEKYNHAARNLANVRISQFTITKSGKDAIDLVPVRVGTVGYMYDRVSGQLFGNSGTGDFVLGPDTRVLNQPKFLLGAKTEVKSWTNPYITDGLVAMWDGEWNGGGGIHHTDTTQKWVELCGTGCDLTYSPVAEIHDFYACNSEGSKYANLARNIEKQWFDFSSGDYTYEICINIETFAQCANVALDGGMDYVSGKKGLCAVTNLGYAMFSHQSAVPAIKYTKGVPVTFAASINGGEMSSTAFANGVAQTITGYHQNVYGRGVSFGSPASDYWLTNGYIYSKFYNVRVYNRALTDAEIASNYAVDQRRFSL